MGGVGRGDRDLRTATELVEQVPVEIVGPRSARTWQDELRPQAVLPDEGRRPVALLVAGHPPELGAGAGVERREVRVFFVVVDHVEPAAMQHRRGRRSPARPHRPRQPAVLPDPPPLHVEAEDAHVAEGGIDPLAIGDRRFRCKTVLEMDGARRRTTGNLGLPERQARVEVKAGDDPANLGFGRLLSVAAEVESLPRILQRRPGDCRGEEHAAAPDDRRRPAAAVEFYFPADVLRGAPAGWQPRMIGRHAPRCRPAKSGPVTIACHDLRR